MSGMNLGFAATVHGLRVGWPSYLMGLTDDELKLWLRLRAVEWNAWPSYVSQPIVPVLLILCPWSYVLLALGVANFLWCLVRYTFVSVRLAYIAPLFVMPLRWPAALGCGFYLLVNGRVVPGLIALAWPLLAGFASIPSKTDVIMLAFAKKIEVVLQLRRSVADFDEVFLRAMGPALRKAEDDLRRNDGES